LRNPPLAVVHPSATQNSANESNDKRTVTKQRKDPEESQGYSFALISGSAAKQKKRANANRETAAANQGVNCGPSPNRLPIETGC
jgi:hypothetical protein